MSFSFSFTAPTKAQAKVRVAEEMAKVLTYCIEHAHDLRAAITVGHAYIDTLGDDPSMDIAVSMYGSLGYQWRESGDPTPLAISSAGVTVSAGYTAKAQ